MASVHVGPDDKQIVISSSETILAASLREGIPHAYACGGRARCSVCRISIEEGLEFCSPRSKGEWRVAERLNFGPETRLACQTTITGDVNVRRLVVDDDEIEFTRGIAEGPRPASIGEEKNLAILFADVRGFTALSERMSPYDVIYFLNRYFHLTSKVIESYGGYVDNYMGDGLMALFGHDDAPDAAFRAASAALTMLDEVEKREVTSALVVLRQNGTCLMTVTAEIHLQAQGTWKASASSPDEILLKITGGVLKGEMTGSGKLLLTSDGKSFRQLTANIKTVDGSEIKVTFEADDSEPPE